MKPKIQIIGYINNYTGGFPKHTKYLCKELSKSFDIIETEITNDKFEPKKADVHILLDLYEKWDKHNIHNLNGIKIGYAVFEGTKLSPNKLASINLDQIWTPSHWFKNVLIQHGINDNKIKIVPEGVDCTIYNPYGPKHPKIKSLSSFKFLSIGRIDERKNFNVMLQAFDEEFKNDNVLLLVFYRGFERKQYSLLNPHKIVEIKPNHYSDNELAQLYRSCDAYISPHKAEGWGLTITEAMACGLPVITTNYSAPTEYLTKNNSYWIDFCVKTHHFFGHLAEPNFNHFKHLMRKTYQEKTDIGKQAALDIQTYWTWEKMGLIATKEINKLLEYEPSK